MPVALDKTQTIKVILPTDAGKDKPVEFHYYYPNHRRQRQLMEAIANFEMIEADTIRKSFDGMAQEVKIGLARIDNLPKDMTADNMLAELNVQEEAFIARTVSQAMPDLEDKKKSE